MRAIINSPITPYRIWKKKNNTITQSSKVDFMNNLIFLDKNYLEPIFKLVTLNFLKLNINLLLKVYQEIKSTVI